MPKNITGTKDDPTIRFSSITIDDKEYRLAYSYAAIVKAEKVTGCNLLLGMMTSDVTNKEVHGANVVLGLFWAALAVAHPEMSMNDAAVLVRPDTISTIINGYIEAQLLSSPDYEPQKKSDEPSNQA